jgi:DNA-binding beta-propeller fold protein YncE
MHHLAWQVAAIGFVTWACSGGDPAWGQSPPVLQPMAQTITLPGSPFAVVPARHAHALFVSLSGDVNGIAVLDNEPRSDKQRGDERRPATLRGVLPTGGAPLGMALSHDGAYLIDAVQAVSGQAGTPGLQILDARKVARLDPHALLRTVPLPAGSAPIEVAWDAHDRFIFVSKEDAQAVSVIDARKALGTHADAAIVGDIPVGRGPVGMAVSANGKYLYVVSEIANAGTMGYDANACETNNGAHVAQGSLTVVDAEKALTDPAHAVLAQVPAGCSPVRVALSDENATVWVTARGDNALLAFRAHDLVDKPAKALLSRTPVGSAPVGFAFFDHARFIAVADSNRFATGQSGNVSIVDTRQALLDTGEAADVGTFAAGSFPRQWAVSEDGRQLFLTEFGANTLAVLDVPSLLHGLQADRRSY